MNGEMPKMPTAFEVVYEFPSPFGGVHRKLDSNRWNGSMPTTSQPVYSQDQLIAYAQEATRQAMERAAKVCDDAAAALNTPGKRTNQVDRHVADVLEAKADAIRALSDVAAQEGKPS